MGGAEGDAQPQPIRSVLYSTVCVQPFVYSRLCTVQPFVYSRYSHFYAADACARHACTLRPEHDGRHPSAGRTEPVDERHTGALSSARDVVIPSMKGTPQGVNLTSRALCHHCTGYTAHAHALEQDERHTSTPKGARDERATTRSGCDTAWTCKQKQQQHAGMGSCELSTSESQKHPALHRRVVPRHAPRRRAWRSSLGGWYGSDSSGWQFLFLLLTPYGCFMKQRYGITASRTLEFCFFDR